MKFLSSFSGGEVVNRFIYEVGTPGGADKIETPFTAEHLAEAAQDDAQIQAKLQELNTRFGGQLTKEEVSALIREADQEEGDSAEDNEDGKLEELKDLERLASILEAKFGAEGADGEKVDMAELGLEGLTKEEAEKITANREALEKSVQEELGDLEVDSKIFNDSFNQVLSGQPKEKLMDEAFVQSQKEAVVNAIEQNNAWVSMKTARESFPGATREQLQALSQGIEGLNAKILAGLRNQTKDGRQVSIPGVGSHNIDARVQKVIDESVEALIAKVKDKTPEEALAALNAGHEEIIAAVIANPIIETIQKENAERFGSKTLTNEALASGVIGGEYEGSENELNLRDGSIMKTADLHIGEPAQDISFPDSENLRTIGAGDLYPPEVRQISINGKIANREGVAGSFFFEGGEYAPIVNGDKVIITKMANDETEEGKQLAEELKTMREERRAAVEKFQFEVDPANDKEIEIAPGQVFKQSELVAQMSERYGLDPNLLMQEASTITSGGAEYLKEINMMARRMQRTLMSSGLSKEEWFVEKDGRRYMNPKALSAFVGGNKDRISQYVERSGAQYSEDEMEALEGHDGLSDFPESGRMTGENARRLAAILSTRFNNSGQGSMRTMAGGIDGMQIESARALLALDTAMRTATGYNGPKGTINSVTGGSHGSGVQSHANGFKVDIRCNPNLGPSAAYGQAMWEYVRSQGASMGADRSGNQRYSVDLPGGAKAWVYRHPPDHLDIKLVSARQYAADANQFNRYT